MYFVNGTLAVNWTQTSLPFYVIAGQGQSVIVWPNNNRVSGAVNDKKRCVFVQYNSCKLTKAKIRHPLQWPYLASYGWNSCAFDALKIFHS